MIQVSATDNEDDAISYEIGSDAAGKFSIDQTTGWITSNVTIDREVFLYMLLRLDKDECGTKKKSDESLTGMA